MCGIAGMARSDPRRPVEESVIIGMRDTLVHRGPDDCGLYVGEGAGLGSRRLSILDLSPQGRMPLATPDGRYHIVHNGEVYNYRTLREPLERKGIRFRSNTDSEVLLRLFEESGPDMLSHLNGMFAFAIWDAQDRSLFLARDRLGVKPLYYAILDGDLLFASEEKALFAAGVPASFDPGTLDELLCFRYVAGEQTPFSGIRRLPPGSYMHWRGGTPVIRQWWNFEERVGRLREDPLGNPGEWFRETFDDAVRLRLISDVPVGVLLSGGLDSSSVAASIAAGGDSTISSFTVRFPEAGFDEGPLARTVADRAGLRYHELMVDGSELLDRLAHASWINDEPLAHASDIHVAAISRYAKDHVTVLLSGEGADESLGGYVRYRPLLHPGVLSALRPAAPLLRGFPGIPRRLAKLGEFLALGSIRRHVQMNAASSLPHQLGILGLVPRGLFPFREEIALRAERLYPREPFRQVMFSDQHTFLCSLLDRNDRMTMGASIECRVPFLDYRLVERLASIPTRHLISGGRGKALLRGAVGNRLPTQVLNGRKWGFGVPWGQYFRQVPELEERVVSLPRHQFLSSLPLDTQRLTETVSRFRSGSNEAEQIVTGLVMLTLWHDVYFPRVQERLREIKRDRAPLL